MKRTILSIGMVLLIISCCQAQTPSLNPNNGVVPAVINSAGGSYDNALSYYRYEWSFGELILVQSFASADSSVVVTQGVLQPCTDIVSNAPHTLLFSDGDYRLFPNPTAGQFEIDFFVKATGRMNLQLIDASGRVLERRDYHYDGCCHIELFDLTRYPNGVYYVVADLKPDNNRPGDNIQISRHSGLKIIKLNSK